ncbi:hypothetical protein B4U79_11576, partial [Dinothrombium tinctorium]
CPGVYDSSVGVAGKNYYGRDYIQLTHSYNYQLVADDERVAWATAFWYCRTRVRNQPNVLRFWFGATTNAISGGLECRGPNQHIARKRFEVYKRVLRACNIHATPIERGCYN